MPTPIAAAASTIAMTGSSTLIPRPLPPSSLTSGLGEGEARGAVYVTETGEE